MEARQIEYFLRIVELGSINRAATELRMSQPSLSRWLALLEHEVGASLLVRTPQGIRMTDAGQLLAERAGPILRQLHSLRDEIGKKASAQFNIAMPFSLQQLVTAPFAEHIIRKTPHIALRIYEGINNSIRMWMEEGAVDAAVMEAMERSPDTFVATPLVREQLLLVGDKSAGLNIDTPVPLSRLGFAHLILPGRPNVISAHVENAMQRAGHRFQNRFEVETLSLCLELTRRGLGYTVMPYSALHGKITQSTVLTAAPIQNLAVTWQLYLNRARTYAISSRAVVDILQQQIKTTIASGEWRFAEIPKTRPSRK